jgi:hypothetical protein
MGGRNGEHGDAFTSTSHCILKDEDKNDTNLERNIEKGDSMLSLFEIVTPELMPIFQNLVMALNSSRGDCSTVVSFYYGKTLAVLDRDQDGLSDSFATGGSQAAEPLLVLHHPYNEWTRRTSLKNPSAPQYEQAYAWCPAVPEVMCIADELQIYNDICPDISFPLSNCSELKLKHRALDNELLPGHYKFTATVFSGLLFASLVVGLCSSTVYFFSKPAVKMLLYALPPPHPPFWKGGSKIALSWNDNDTCYDTASFHGDFEG